MARHGVATRITIDGSRVNAAAIAIDNVAHGTSIAVCQVPYLNNIVEQDHRAVKRIARPMLGFKSVEVARCTIVGIGVMHMIRKGQLEGGTAPGLTVAEQFYRLAG
jgi:putative transposase